MDSSLHGISAVGAAHDRRHADAQKFADKTQSHYIRARCDGWPPSLAAHPTRRRPRIWGATNCIWSDLGTSPVSLNAAATGLKFFFEVTLDQGELMAKMDPVR